MIDVKDLVIVDLTLKLQSIEAELRKAGTIEMEAYHNQRDVSLAREFLRMADSARESLDYALSMAIYS